MLYRILINLVEVPLHQYIQINTTRTRGSCVPIRDRPFNLKGGVMFFFRTSRELEYLCFLSREAWIFFPEFNIRLYDKNSESYYFFFPPPKSEYFFQQHWESEYQVKWSFPCIHQISTRVDAYKYSFLPRTIVSWNFLPPELRSQPTVESFRHHIQKIPSLCLDSSETCEQYQLLLTVNRDILIVHTLAIFCCSPTMRWSFNRLVDEFTPYREEEDLLLWNSLAKWTKTWYEASMEGRPL
jgi:hypothetical protein